MVVSVVTLPGGGHVKFELESVTPEGQCRLTVVHPATRFVQYFSSPTAALAWQAEIADVLTGRREVSLGVA